MDQVGYQILDHLPDVDKVLEKLLKFPFFFI